MSVLAGFYILQCVDATTVITYIKVRSGVGVTLDIVSFCVGAETYTDGYIDAVLSLCAVDTLLVSRSSMKWCTA